MVSAARNLLGGDAGVVRDIFGEQRIAALVVGEDL
jgi:hypothetical protein